MWEEKLERYCNVDEQLRLYDIDAKFENFTIRTISIESQREEIYHKIATQPLPYTMQKIRWATADKTYICADKRKRTHVTIPADISLPIPPQGHNLNGKTLRSPLRVPWKDLLE